jgi:hypothetical protein
VPSTCAARRGVGPSLRMLDLAQASGLLLFDPALMQPTPRRRMKGSDDTPSSTTADHPDYLPPPPRPAQLNARAAWSRAGLLAGLLLAPPFVLYLGQTSGEELRALTSQGRTANGAIVPRG